MCIVVIDCLGRSQLKSFAQKLWERMDEWGIAKNMDAYCAYMRWLMRSTSLASIELDIEDLRRRFHLESLPRPALDLLIRAAAHRFEYKKAVKYFRQLIHSGYVPSANNVRHLMFMFARLGSADTAFTLLKRMCMMGVSDHSVFEKLMAVFIQKRKSEYFTRVVRLMEAADLAPRSMTYRYLLLGATLHGTSAAVLGVWDRIKAASIVPDDVLWSAYFDALGHVFAYSTIVDSFKVLLFIFPFLSFSFLDSHAHTSFVTFLLQGEFQTSEYKLEPKVIKMIFLHLLGLGNRMEEALDVLRTIVHTDPQSVPIVAWFYWRQFLIRHGVQPFVHGPVAIMLPQELRQRVRSNGRNVFASFRSLADVVLIVMKLFLKQGDEVTAAKVCPFSRDLCCAVLCSD
jgi:hypothetical protein